MPNPNKMHHINANNQRKTGQPVNILLRLLPFGPDRIGRSNVHPAFLSICMKQSSCLDKFFMWLRGLIIPNKWSSRHQLGISMAVLGLQGRCRAHGPRLCCNKSAVHLMHSALKDRQYAPQHPNRTEPFLQHRHACRIQASLN